MIETITFEQWMEEVERFLSENDYPGTAGLPDYGYRDAYDAGSTPAEAAADAVVESLYSFGL
jgi:hypothetical protein